MPGPYTLSGRLIPNDAIPGPLGADRGAAADRPQRSSKALVAAGCREITVDEPSMSCYAHREDPNASSISSTARSSRWSGSCRLVDPSLLRQLQGARRRPAQVRADVPGVSRPDVDEIHLEMASREFAEIEIIAEIADDEGRRGRHHRREELLHRNAAGRGRPRAPLPEARAGRPAQLRAGLRAVARPRAGPRSRSSPTWSRACASRPERAGAVTVPDLSGRPPDGQLLSCGGSARVAFAIRYLRRAGRARSVSLRLAHQEIRGHRTAPRPDARRS